MAFLTKGTTFSIKEKAGSASAEVISGLQEIPSLGGTPDKIEITTLASANHEYMNGLKDFGDLAFKFLYELPTGASETNFETLKGYEGKVCTIEVGIPDGTSGAVDTTFTFDADISVSLDGFTYNNAMTFTCNCGLQSDITVA